MQIRIDEAGMEIIECTIEDENIILEELNRFELEQVNNFEITGDYKTLWSYIYALTCRATSTITII